MFEWSERKAGKDGENPTRFYESQEFRDAISHLETYEHLSVHEKVLLLVTALDLKPAAFVVTKPGATQEEFEAIATNLGLFIYHDTTRHLNERQMGVYTYKVANTQEILDEVIKSSVRVGVDDERFGNLMGYPNTATKAFTEWRESGAEGKLMPYSADNPELTDEEERFTLHRYSKEHFQKRFSGRNNWLLL